MRLTIQGQPSVPTIEFSLRQETGDGEVDVYANNDLIGWFKVSKDDGKVVFVRSLPCQVDTKAAFSVDKGTGFITVVDQ